VTEGPSGTEIPRPHSAWRWPWPHLRWPSAVCEQASISYNRSLPRSSGTSLPSRMDSEEHGQEILRTHLASSCGHPSCSSALPGCHSAIPKSISVYRFPRFFRRCLAFKIQSILWCVCFRKLLKKEV